MPGENVVENVNYRMPLSRVLREIKGVFKHESELSIKEENGAIITTVTTIN